MSKPAEQKRNSWSDEDLEQLVQRRDEAMQEERDAKEAASDKRKRAIKIIEAEAKNVGVPLKSFRKLVKVRDLEAKLKAEVETLPEDEIEVFADMQGQLSFLKPVKIGETAAQVAARLRTDEIARITEQEQAEGEAALAELAGAVH
jgi:hypothetical protein